MLVFVLFLLCQVCLAFIVVCLVKCITMFSNQLLLFFSTERPDVKNTNRVDQIQTKIICSLRDHCTYNSLAQKKANYFSKILATLTEMRTLSMEGMQRMTHLNQVIRMPSELTSILFTSSPAAGPAAQASGSSSSSLTLQERDLEF